MATSQIHRGAERHGVALSIHVLIPCVPVGLVARWQAPVPRGRRRAVCASCRCVPLGA
jgi:hypothetical protein